MIKGAVPLNVLRAFEAASRHLSFTKAAEELCVTQTAISHQIKSLEERLKITLFRRSPRGLTLTDEGLLFAPTLSQAFGSIDRVFAQFESGGVRDILTVGVVGTFMVGALLERLPAFRESHPLIDLRLLTNNNKVDLVAESLDYAIRFGDGAWHGMDAEPICQALLTPLCSPALARKLHEPIDLARVPLLRSYRSRDWPSWFQAAGIPTLRAGGPLFDSSLVMVQAAMHGEGVALAPHCMFRRELEARHLVQPFQVDADAGSYWLTHIKSKTPTATMLTFRSWLRSSFQS
jgi:LysR family transcriptional regulator of beta-lactamase